MHRGYTAEDPDSEDSGMVLDFPIIDLPDTVTGLKIRFRPGNVLYNKTSLLRNTETIFTSQVPNFFSFVFCIGPP